MTKCQETVKLSVCVVLVFTDDFQTASRGVTVWLHSGFGLCSFSPCDLLYIQPFSRRLHPKYVTINTDAADILLLI